MKPKIQLEIIFGISIMCLISVSTASSHLDVNIEKKIVTPGDIINITAMVSNPINETVHLWTSLYSLNKMDFLGPDLAFEIKPLETKKIRLYEIEVKENFLEGTYEVSTSLVHRTPYNMSVIDSENMTFIITGIKPRIDVDFLACKDKSCFEKSIVFIKGEKVYLDYDTDVSNLIINAELTYPDTSKQKISLPTSIVVEQIGSYEIMVVLSKEGYQTATRTLQFAVIERKVEIINASVCNADGVCLGRENYGNCPQDCPKPSVTSSTTTLPSEKPEGFEYIPQILALFIGILIIFLIYRKTKK